MHMSVCDLGVFSPSDIPYYILAAAAASRVAAWQRSIEIVPTTPPPQPLQLRCWRWAWRWRRRQELLETKKQPCTTARPVLRPVHELPFGPSYLGERNRVFPQHRTTTTTASEMCGIPLHYPYIPDLGTPSPSKAYALLPGSGRGVD